MTVEELAAAAVEDDPRLRDLLSLLPEAWAHTPTDTNGEGTALAFVRAAYGAGYQAGLQERLS